jgi:hypothetical protein
VKKINEIFYRLYLKFWKKFSMVIYFRSLRKVGDWSEWAEIDKFFGELSADPYFKNFRRHRLLIQTMDYQGFESMKYSKTLTRMDVKESNIGRPLRPLFLRNSLNLGHQYKHMNNWMETTGIDLYSINRIVEFGGGYGSMRWLVNELGFKNNYVIVDNEGIKQLQSRYLKESLGEGIFKQTSWKNSIDMIDPKLNSNDLFIALWSLSETPDDMMQMWINEVNNSNCHLLIAYQHNFHGRDNSAFFESKFTITVEKPVVGLSGGSTSTYIFK